MNNYQMIIHSDGNYSEIQILDTMPKSSDKLNIKNHQILELSPYSIT